MAESSVVLKSSVFFASESSSTPNGWDAMKSAWLKNDGMRIVDPKEGRYAIIRYDRTKSANTSSPSSIPNPWLRSVVIDKTTCMPVCVAPCKSTDLPRGDDSWSTSMKNVEVQHFVDGVMINLFWMPNEDKPHVSTRSRIGADNSFYSTMSFVEMLNDGVKYYASKKTPGFNGTLNDLKPVSNYPTPQFISVVLQHPKNRVVTEVKDPRITVVHIGFVEADSSVKIVLNPKDWNESLQKLAPGVITLPECTLDSYKSLSDYVETQGKEFGYMWQGLVLKGSSGTRYRIRNKAYSQVRSLRGNEADSVERFCRLRGTRNIKKYLVHYPEDATLFYELEGKLRSATRKILDYYTKTFKVKKQEFHTLPWPYKHHVSVLHNVFKEKLKPAKKTVELENVVEYVNSLSVEDMSNLFKEPKQSSSVSPNKNKPEKTPVKEENKDKDEKKAE